MTQLDRLSFILTDGKAQQRFYSKVAVDHVTGCHIWQGSYFIPYGYPAFMYKGQSMRSNRVALVLATGKLPTSLQLQACHNCPAGDNKACVNPKHLFWGTPKEHGGDRIRKGQVPVGTRNGRYTHPESTRCGVRHPNSKLLTHQIRVIKSLRRRGLSFGAIAALFPVQKKCIMGICKKRAWTHVK